MNHVRFLLDRSLGQLVLPARLRGAGWDARTLAEEFGDQRAQQMPDQEWIGEGAKAGFILLAKDHRLAVLRVRSRQMPSMRTMPRSSCSLAAT